MVDYAKVKTLQAPPTLVVPLPVGFAIGTVGSSVIRTNYWKMRDAAAAAREMLVQAAMNLAGDQTRANYQVAAGVVTNTVKKLAYTYGQLAAAAGHLPLPSGAQLVPDSQLKLIGKTLPRLDIPLKVDGRALYGLDVRVPGMVYAVVKHCPNFGGTLATKPATPSGMSAVVPLSVAAGTGRGTEITGNVNAIAVVGPNTWDTWQAARRMHVSWILPPATANLNTATFQTQAQALLTSATPYAAGAPNGPGTLFTVEGNAAAVNAAMAGAVKTVDAQYKLPYVAHACMEVLNCTVNYVPGVSCEVWVPRHPRKPPRAYCRLRCG